MLLKEISGLLFVGLGTALLVVSAWNAARAIKSRAWPQCDGTIASSDVETVRNEGLLHRASITYLYRIDDQGFVGTRACFCDWLWSSWRSSAAGLARRFPAGASVPVYYDPTDPNESVLEPGMNGFIFGSFALGALAVALGLASALTQ